MTPLRVGVLTAKTLDERARDAVAMVSAGDLDHVGSIDHVCFRGAQGVDGLTTAALLAGLHRTLGVYVGVYLLPLRHPVVVARQLSTLGRFAPGRVVFGVGIGGEDHHEFASCGVDVRTRGRRADESLALLRRLLAGEAVSFAGEFFHLEDTQILPAPVPAVPLVVGGRSDAAVRRAGRLGDGWIGIFNSPERFAAAVELAERTAADAGRGAVRWQHAMELWCGFGPSVDRARRRLAAAMEGVYGLPFGSFERYCPVGTPEHVAEALAPYVEAGCRTLNLIPVAPSLEEAIHSAAQVKQLLAGGVSAAATGS